VMRLNMGGMQRARDKEWEGTMPVGSFPAGASPFGALDMAGNVWEWTADWYADRYPAVTAPNPTGPLTGTERVIRGGSWYDVVATRVRAAFRDKSGPAVRSVEVGFRCARGAVLADEVRVSPVIGRVINTAIQGSELTVTIGAGSSSGIRSNWTAHVLSGNNGEQPLAGGEIKVVRVDKAVTVGKVKLTADQLLANPRVRLAAP